MLANFDIIWACLLDYHLQGVALFAILAPVSTWRVLLFMQSTQSIDTSNSLARVHCHLARRQEVGANQTIVFKSARLECDILIDAIF